MRKNRYILGGLILGTLLMVASTAHAQVQSNYWKLLANVLQPNVASWSLKIPELGGGGVSCVEVDNNGLFFTSGSACGSGSGGSFPFTPATSWGVNTSATTTALWGQDSVFASSTSATVPALSASNSSGPAAVFGTGNVGIASTAPQSALTVGVAGTSAIPAIAVGTNGNQGLYAAGTNSLGFEAGGGGFQWNGTAVTPNSVNKTLGTTANPWSKLSFGAPTGGWSLSTSTLSTGAAWLSNGGYPSLFIGADDASPISNVELNSVNQGNYASYGIKINNGGSTYSGVVGMDITDTIAGIPDYLFIDNQTGSATCLQIKDNGATCLSDYNTLSSLLDTISPAYNVAGTEAGMTTTLLQANGQDAVDYGIQNYPGTFATGIDAYQNYYANVYAQPLPEPDFSFWEQANGNTSEASTSWHWLVATTTPYGTQGTTTAIAIGDVGTSTPNAFALINPGAATLQLYSSSSRAVALSVEKVLNQSTTTDFQVLNTGTASSTNYVDSSLTSGNCVQASTGGLLTTTAGACGSGGGTPGGSATNLQYQVNGTTFGGVSNTSVAASGNIGLASSTPWAELSISTTTALSYGLPLFDVGSSTNADLFNVQTNGNVGISSTSPYALLSIFDNAQGVSQPASTPFAIGSSTAAGVNSTLFSINNRGQMTYGGVTASAAVTGTGNLVLATGPTFGGTVGLATAAGGNAAGSLLTIEGSSSASPTTAALTLRGAAAGQSIVISSSSAAFASSTPWGQVAINPVAGVLDEFGRIAPDFVIGSSTGTDLIVAASGNVGIGTTSPYALLSVNAPAGLDSFAVGSSTGTWLKVTSLGTTTVQKFDSLGTATSTWNNGINLTAGCFSINNVCVGTGGGSGITAITGPTGLTFSGTPTSVGTLASGFSIKELPSWTVCSSGCDFTTIQAALNAASSTNGTNGGGTIYLTDAVYNQGGTGLLIKSPNTTITANASTTINFTGATTLFKSAAPAYQFSNVNITNLTLVGDGTAGSIAIDMSNMSHSTYANLIISTVGTEFKVDDTQNITFYNTISNTNGSTISQFGINASSTNPWNGNLITNNFIGCSSASCVGMQITNANGDVFSKNSIEPASANNTVDIKIFDNAIATCNGVFNNTFSGNYIEGGKTTGGTQGIQIDTNLCSNGGIQRNDFDNNVVENHALDYSFPTATSTLIAAQTWNNNMNSNFGNPLTSFQGPFGIGTSSELAQIGATGPDWTFFGISPQAGVATNDFTIGSSTATLLNVNNAGQLQVDNGGQINQVTSGTAIPLQVEANSSGVPIGLSVFDSGFANSSDLVKINQVNGSDTGPALHILDAGTGPALYVQTGNSGFGTSTPQWEIDAANATKPQLSLTDGTLTSTPWDFRSISGAFYISTSSVTTFATSSNALFSIVPSTTANATTTFSLTDWVLKQTSQTALIIEDAFGTPDVAVNTSSTTGSIFTVAATTSPSIFAPTKLFDVDQYGHETASSSLAEPTLGTCSGGATFDTNSNDVTGGVTLTTAVTSCAIVFASAYAATPEVILTGANTTSYPAVTARSTTGFTIGTGAAVTGDHISYYVLQP